MSNNTQFPVALHILISLALSDGWMTSEELAWSVGTNASMVRRILSALNRAGLVTSRAGPTGGVKLARDPRGITLLDALSAVDVKPAIALHKPNRECPLGAILRDPLAAVLEEAGRAADSVYAERTVHELAQAARRRIGRRAGEKRTRAARG